MPSSLCHAAYPHTPQVAGCPRFRDIDIQAYTLWKTVREDMAADTPHYILHRAEVSVSIIVAEGESHRRDTLDRPLEGYAHRPAIVSVGRCVVPMVYSADDERRLAGAEQRESHLDAVDRCAVA